MLIQSRLTVQAVLVSLSLLILPAREARACSCQYITDAIAGSDLSVAVFSGRVVALELVPTSNPHFRPENEDLLVHFEVADIWKGRPDPRTTVRTARALGACGYDFQIGSQYLVYAVQSNGELFTSICSRTDLLRDAQQDLSELGPPVNHRNEGHNDT